VDSLTQMWYLISLSEVVQCISLQYSIRKIRKFESDIIRQRIASSVIPNCNRDFPTEVKRIKNCSSRNSGVDVTISLTNLISNIIVTPENSKISHKTKKNTLYITQNKKTHIVDHMFADKYEATQTHCCNPVVLAYPVWAYYAHGRQRRCQEDPVSLPSGRLEKTTRSSSHHLSQHSPTGS